MYPDASQHISTSMIAVGRLFDLSRTRADKWMETLKWPWDILPMIHQIILELGPDLSKNEFEHAGEKIWIARDCKIADTASLTGPLIIDHESEIRHCAFIRGSALIGKNTVVGNSTELKNCILFDSVQVPHYNYVGDSVLGYKSHMGAGAITSNVKGNHSLVTCRVGAQIIETQLKKFGALLGDYAEVGCNSVLNPGSILGRNCQVYPLAMVRGFVPENSIFKQQNDIVIRQGPITD